MLSEIPLFLLVLHFIGDFLLQSNWMAMYKSKDVRALTVHVVCYSFPFLWLPANFCVALVATHFITDFFTSRITSRLWFIETELVEDPTKIFPVYKVDFNEWRRHWFFVCIGADQLIHFLTLAMIWDLPG